MKRLQNIKIALGCRMPCRHHSNVDVQKASYVDLIRTLVKCALDNSKWQYRFDRQEDCFYSTFSLDDTTEFILALKPRANYIHAQSIAVKKAVDALKLTDALLFCNKWNSKSLFPKHILTVPTTHLLRNGYDFRQRNKRKIYQGMSPEESACCQYHLF